jgi:hypothetical protein
LNAEFKARAVRLVLDHLAKCDGWVTKTSEVVGLGPARPLTPIITTTTLVAQPEGAA